MRTRALLASLGLVLLSCASRPPTPSPTPTPGASSPLATTPAAAPSPIAAPSSASPVAGTAAPAGTAAAAAAIELVESWPRETSLDHADLRDAKDVWREMIDGATRRLDFAEFYASDDPAGPSALTPIVAAIERAASRGVKVRWLADAKFSKTYPELLERFARAGVQVRRFDPAPTLGGVLHAKYFLADGQGYLGSQNFDWRSLEHIQELGARIAVPEVARALSDVFELDWTLAGGGTAHPASPAAATGAAMASAPTGFPLPVAGDGGRVTFVASPKGWLPDERLWDLPALVKLIDSAHATVRAQVLTYRAHGGHGEDFPELDDALKRAAARGVQVQLLVSDWSKHEGNVAGLLALQGAAVKSGSPPVQVRFLDIPMAASGFIPFARVVHAKYLVVDGQSAWVGTSNWERDYFYASRNVGLVLDGGSLPARLDAFFTQNWGSPYAEPLEAGKKYTPPRVAQ